VRNAVVGKQEPLTALELRQAAERVRLGKRVEEPRRR
jgi:hypothetical protein